MAVDHPGGDAVKTACPVRCRRHDAAGNNNPPSGQASAPDQVDWAGLPINLDFAFSEAQRDKVYLQHLRRKRGAQMWRRSQNDAQQCTCDIAAEHARDHGDAEKLRITS